MKPKIYAFQNFSGGGEGPGLAIAEDGTVLADHWSSNFYWAKHDLGVTSNWKHDYYRAHYPDGYDVEFVHDEDFETHAGLQAALALHKSKEGAEKS